MPDGHTPTPLGRPRLPIEMKKVPVTLRLAPDLVHAMRAKGPGWGHEAEDVLRAHYMP